jgi:hypothetical protein
MSAQSCGHIKIARHLTLRIDLDINQLDGNGNAALVYTQDYGLPDSSASISRSDILSPKLEQDRSHLG